jgi:hypothetical protein
MRKVNKEHTAGACMAIGIISAEIVSRETRVTFANRVVCSATAGSEPALLAAVNYNEHISCKLLRYLNIGDTHQPDEHRQYI